MLPQKTAETTTRRPSEDYKLTFQSSLTSKFSKYTVLTTAEGYEDAHSSNAGDGVTPRGDIDFLAEDRHPTSALAPCVRDPDKKPSKADLHVVIVSEPLGATDTWTPGGRKHEMEARHAHLSSPSSGSTVPHIPLMDDLEDLEGLSDPLKDEHDRALAAFLRENGYATLTRRQCRSLAGYHPLHSAASQGLLRMTEILIKAGADPSQKNYLGQTPLDVAKRCNRKGSHAGILDVLQKASIAAPVA
jgi:hypothetical protein